MYYKDKLIRPLTWLIPFLLGALTYAACGNSRPSMAGEQIIYFSQFDLFLLHGFDTLRQKTMNHSVEVQYLRNIPVQLKYYRERREVTLMLEDSFALDTGHTVYVYGTSNFHGGPPGLHRVYATHYEEYKDLIYVSKMDTILCKSYELPVSGEHGYTLYRYVKAGKDSIIKLQSWRHSSEDNKLTKAELYQAWMHVLDSTYKNVFGPPITVKELPE